MSSFKRVMFRQNNIVKKWSSPQTTKARIVIRPKASYIDMLNTQAYYVGKSIILFTMFYTGLNYLTYRDMREEEEQKENENNNKKSNKK
jgi:hypothetical protein